MRNNVFTDIGFFVVASAFMFGVIGIMYYALKNPQIEEYARKNSWVVPVLVILMLLILVLGTPLFLVFFDKLF